MKTSGAYCGVGEQPLPAVPLRKTVMSAECDSASLSAHDGSMAEWVIASHPLESSEDPLTDGFYPVTQSTGHRS